MEKFKKVKVLIICSGNAPNFSFEKHQAFIYDQTKAISKHYPEFRFEIFPVEGKGINGYLSNLPRLKKKLSQEKYDLVHAHYGLSGFLAILQRNTPVVTTFHNGELLSFRGKLFSSFAAYFSKLSIYVAWHIYNGIYYKPKKMEIIPCGIELDEISLAKNIDDDNHRFKILFGGSFDNKRKNYLLLKKAIEKIENNVEIIELKGFSRTEVYEIINNSHLMVLPSLAEGSPQIIKEAMACNCPIVSTDVGDVKEVIGDTEGCYICSFEPEDVAKKIKMALEFAKAKGRTNGRQRIIELGLDNKTIAQKIVQVYKSALT